jgi:flagellar motor switch protein FliM
MRQKRKNHKRRHKAKKDEDVPTEVLSQEEIEKILNAINVIDAVDSAGANSKSLNPAFHSRKIRIYDFKRPDRFSKKQIRAICVLHETFARQAAFALTDRFKMPCHIYVASVDQLTYEEYTRSIPTPTALAAVSVEKPLSRQAAIEIDPAITFALVNRAFGGDGGGAKPPARELTRIEWVVMKDVMERLVDCMERAWETVIPNFKADIHRLDAAPQFINVARPSDMTVLVTCEARIGDVEGMINIDYPYDCLSGVLEKLSAQFWYGGNKALPRNKKYKLADRMDVPVEIIAEVFRRDYPLKKILAWKEEELLLPLAPRASDTCFLRFGDQRVFECSTAKDDKWFPKKALVKNIAENPYKTEGKMKTSEVNPLVAEALSEAGVTISVELGRAVKTIKEILKMDEGTVVELDSLAGEPVDIKANGVLIAKGEVVVIDENFGVRVIEIVKAKGSLDSAGSKEGG